MHNAVEKCISFVRPMSYYGEIIPVRGQFIIRALSSCLVKNTGVITWEYWSSRSSVANRNGAAEKTGALSLNVA